MKIILIGARGHARAVADVIKAEGRYEIEGLLDSFQKPGTYCFGYKIFGGEKNLPQICNDLNIHKIIIAIGDNYQRQAMSERVKKRSLILNLFPASTLQPSLGLMLKLEQEQSSCLEPSLSVDLQSLKAVS